VVITNQVMSDPGGSLFTQGGAKAVGGNIMAHACDHIIQMRKGKGEQRIVKIIQSPCMGEGECAISITAGGIIDAVD
jgi:meiotic recombination protein DMC1